MPSGGFPPARAHESKYALSHLFGSMSHFRSVWKIEKHDEVGLPCDSACVLRAVIPGLHPEFDEFVGVARRRGAQHARHCINPAGVCPVKSGVGLPNTYGTPGRPAGRILGSRGS
jgi:hypothetical protein